MLSSGEAYAATSDPDRSLEALLRRGAARRSDYVPARTRGCGWLADRSNSGRPASPAES
jgi:hypothetical protein